MASACKIKSFLLDLEFKKVGAKITLTDPKVFHLLLLRVIDLDLIQDTGRPPMSILST